MVKGTEVASNDLDHITNMAVTPMYVKTLPQNKWTDYHETKYVALRIWSHYYC